MLWNIETNLMEISTNVCTKNVIYLFLMDLWIDMPTWLHTLMRLQKVIFTNVWFWLRQTVQADSSLYNSFRPSSRVVILITIVIIIVVFVFIGRLNLNFRIARKWWCQRQWRECRWLEWSCENDSRQSSSQQYSMKTEWKTRAPKSFILTLNLHLNPKQFASIV